MRTAIEPPKPGQQGYFIADGISRFIALPAHLRKVLEGPRVNKSLRLNTRESPRGSVWFARWSYGWKACKFVCRISTIHVRTDKPVPQRD